ncbi:hypothetical protein PIROE2DRAFT_6734 [Piromyces sp. E2]|nr:hypothetical protein PIROE2DRAFT_6734 [Piromyces sp. E2]|eukprot:OUM66115.1 hypothetical protein PIROE2DRAFT_6734 [Piromyces sp. E2]
MIKNSSIKIYLFLLLLIEHFLFIKIYALRDVFNVLIKEPELINEDLEEWKEKYQTLVDYEEYDYYKYTEYQLNNLWERNFDMFIMDDRFLFNDVGLMETDLLWFRLIYKRNLISFSDYVKDKDIDYHNPLVLKDGSYDNKIYGLPYEVDFDVLYYHDEEKSKNIVNNIENSTWDDVLESIKNNIKENSPEDSFPLKISLNTTDDLLNLFVEYTSNHYNLSEDNDSKYYEFITLVFFILATGSASKHFAGSRLLYILQNPEDFKKVDGKYLSVDLRNYVPKKKYKISYTNLLSGLKQVVSKRTTMTNSTFTESSANSNGIVSNK